MSLLLLWLALPLLLNPWLAGERQAGGSIGRLAMTGLGLAALQQGAGTLDPSDLRVIANQSAHEAWFVGITVGVMITGGCDIAFTTLRRSWRTLPSVPLLVCLLVVGLPHGGPLLTGLVVGLIPALAGLIAPGTGFHVGAAQDAPAVRPDRLSIVLGVTTAVVALCGPALLAFAGLGALAWREWFRTGTAGSSRKAPAAEAAATLMLIGWAWLALTIAGAPLVSLRAIATEAPISQAAGRGLALLTIGWGIGIAAAGPLDRPGRVGAQLPVVAVVLLLASMVAPDGMAHWQPVATPVLVLCALAAIARRHWDGSAAAMVLLAATRGGGIAALAAVMMATAPWVRTVRLPAGLRGAMAGVALALVIATVLTDQVLSAVILAVGAASLATRSGAVVARAPGRVHV